MAELLHSSAEERLTWWRRLLTLQLFLRTGPFWDAMQEFRARWGIVPSTRVATEADHIPFPPVCPEPSSAPRQPDNADPYDWTLAAACWQEAVGPLIRRAIPEDFRIPRDRLRSLRLWFPFI